MSWVDLPVDRSKLLAPSGHCAEAMRRGLVPSWPNVQFRPVKVPGPTLSPDDVAVDTLAEHLAVLYKQAFYWSGQEHGDLKSKYFMALTILRKNNCDLARRMKVALRQLKDQGSRLPLMIWAWWVIQRGYEKDKKGASPQAVFEAKRITDKRVRGFFWRDCGQGMENQPPLWTTACKKAFYLHQDFLRVDAHVKSVAEAASFWELWYAREFHRLALQAESEYGLVNDKVQERVWAYDLGMWLTTDIPTYLKMPTLVSTSL